MVEAILKKVNWFPITTKRGAGFTGCQDSRKISRTRKPLLPRISDLEIDDRKCARSIAGSHFCCSTRTGKPQDIYAARRIWPFGRRKQMLYCLGQIMTAS